MLRKIHPAGRNVSVNQIFTLTFLPAGWILRKIVNFLLFYHLIKGMCPTICGNRVLLIYLKSQSFKIGFFFRFLTKISKIQNVLNFWKFRFLSKNLNFQMFKTVLDIYVFVQS